MDEIFEKMTLAAYSDIEFKNAVGEPYKVKINPESFERSLSVTAATTTEEAEKNGTFKDNSSVGKESYSFDLVFDGTGVVEGVVGSDAVEEEFQTFLKVVYWRLATKADNENAVDEGTSEEMIPQDQKLPNYVLLTYCKHSFRVMLDSMTIKYVLMHRDGKPLRIKASCRFSTAQKTKVNDETDKNKDSKSNSKSKSKSKKKTVKEDTPSKDCACVCPNYEETVTTAKQNDSPSLMSCDHSKEEMSGVTYTPVSGELNYTPVDGG